MTCDHGFHSMFLKPSLLCGAPPPEDTWGYGGEKRAHLWFCRMSLELSYLTVIKADSYLP